MASPIRIGIIGLGRAGWGMHVPELTSKGREAKFQIVAGCDVLPERTAQLAQRCGCRTYRNARDLIADPEVELVDIATPSPDHVGTGIAALKAGKRVFMEKPLTLDYAEGKRLMANAAKSKGRLYVRHNRRFEPTFQHIREIMASGILGDVYSLKLRRNGYARRDDWQTLIKSGGGQLLNWGPHIIDHALCFLESPVARQFSDLKRIAAVGDAEDHVRIVLVGKNGRVVDLEISGGSALGEPTYLVFGTRGALSSDEREIRLRHLDPKAKLPPRRANPGTPPYGNFGTPEQLSWIEQTIPVSPELKVNCDDIWDYLHAAIRLRKPYPIANAQALEVMRVISAAKKGTPFAGK